MMQNCIILLLTSFVQKKTAIPFFLLCNRPYEAPLVPCCSNNMLQNCTQKNNQIVKKIFFDAKTHHSCLPTKTLKKNIFNISMI